MLVLLLEKRGIEQEHEGEVSIYTIRRKRYGPRMKTLKDLNFDGKSIIESLLESSAYGHLEQAVASLTAFAHPDTVSTLSGCNVFRIIQGRTLADQGKIVSFQDGKLVMYDGKKGPTDAFMWAHGFRDSDYRDLELIHIWPTPKSVGDYTNLANLCMMPTFLVKLGETEPCVQHLVRYRCHELFGGYLPAGEAAPEKPDRYDELTWMDPLDPVENLEATYREAMALKPADSTTKAARVIGWLFSGFNPDHKI
ncbi:MAG: hypothetical protein AAF492_05705 [Verrucomicrobiota bacterium]